MNLFSPKKVKNPNKILLLANSDEICLNSLGKKEIKFLEGITSENYDFLYLEITLKKGILADFFGELVFGNEILVNISVSDILFQSKISFSIKEKKKNEYFFLNITKINNCKCMASAQLYGVKA